MYIFLVLYFNRYGNGTGDKIFRFENHDEINVLFITKLIREIHHGYDKGSKKRGAILVFLPGWDTISEIMNSLTSEKIGYNSRDNPNYEEDITVFCLHSGVEMDEQVKVFRPAKTGYRKVILSTNIVLFWGIEDLQMKGLTGQF